VNSGIGSDKRLAMRSCHDFTWGRNVKWINILPGVSKDASGFFVFAVSHKKCIMCHRFGVQKPTATAYVLLILIA
jgi:hypothetical protein